MGSNEIFKHYINKNKDRFVDEMVELLKIPSVSTHPDARNDCFRCAQHVGHLLRSAGFQNVEEIVTDGLPIVYGDLITDQRLPTVLIYGHYDVQPADPIDLWVTPAFDPALRDGYIYARGASDDKGQVLCHIKAIETFVQSGEPLPVNIKIIVEGEEEISSPSFSKFLEENRDRLKSDLCLISDTPMLSEDQPSVCTSLRGISYFEIKLIGAATDLHSGQNGGPAPNPIHGLAHIIASLKDDQNRVSIPGFYDDVIPIPEQTRLAIQGLPVTTDTFARQIGAKGLSGENGYHLLEQIWYRPTLDCNGIWGGFTGVGSKTVIPSEASAKISMRLVRNQDPARISTQFKDYIRSLVPSEFHLEITEFASGAPFGIDPDHPAVLAAINAVTDAFGKKAILQGEGGSIPIVKLLETQLGIATILMGFNLPNDSIHAPNERFKLDRFFKGILAVIYFIQQMGR